MGSSEEYRTEINMHIHMSWFKTRWKLSSTQPLHLPHPLWWEGDKRQRLWVEIRIYWKTAMQQEKQTATTLITTLYKRRWLHAKMLMEVWLTRHHHSRHHMAAKTKEKMLDETVRAHGFFPKPEITKNNDAEPSGWTIHTTSPLHLPFAPPEKGTKWLWRVHTLPFSSTGTTPAFSWKVKNLCTPWWWFGRYRVTT